MRRPGGGMRPGHPLRPVPGRERLFFRGRGIVPGWWGWWWWPWGYFDPIYPTCNAWSPPIALTTDLASIGQIVLDANTGQPASVQHDSSLYLFSLDNGALTVRACTG